MNDKPLTRIFLSPPHMGPNERQWVSQAFDSNWIAPLGPLVDGFEADLAAYTRVGHAAALSSGTGALHLALVLLGVAPGDYVICQSMTFSASANPIRYQGAIPVFVDSEPLSWNLCPEALEGAVKGCLSGKFGPAKAPKAIIGVHLYGMPYLHEEIQAVADRYEIPVIEDAAEALGSRYDKKLCGGLGLMGILSFNGNKIITTSGGGALLSDDEALIQKARFLATQARDPAPHYQHSHIGYNYRMSNVLAGIGRGQMQVLDERVQAHRANYAFYHRLLSHHPGVSFQQGNENMFSNRWLTTLLLDPALSGGTTREDLRLALEAQNIESRPLWKPMHMQPVFSHFPYVGGKVAAELFEQGLCLPSGSSMEDEERERIALVLRSLLCL